MDQQANTCNLYSLLGCEESASAQQLKRRYKQLALKLHPDRGAPADDGPRVNSAGGEELTEASASPAFTSPSSCCSTSCDFSHITQAYAILSDHEARRKHDAHLLAERTDEQALIHDEVSIKQFTRTPDSDLYHLLCRCGSSFTFHANNSPAAGSFILTCDSCSLCVLVNVD